MSHFTSLRGNRLLLIEPDDLVRMLTADTLDIYDAEVVSVPNLQGALELLTQGASFDCVIASIGNHCPPTVLEYVTTLRIAHPIGPIVMMDSDSTSSSTWMPAEVYSYSKPYQTHKLIEFLSALTSER